MPQTNNQPSLPPIAMIGGEPAAISHHVALALGIEHDKLLEDINKLLETCPKESAEKNFIHVTAKDAAGNESPAYALRYPGLMLLFANYDTPQAQSAQTAYIMAFNGARERAEQMRQFDAALTKRIDDAIQKKLDEFRKSILEEIDQKLKSAS